MMGGRLGAGAGSGGIVTLYAFVPPAPVGGTGVGGSHQYQNPQMSNVGMAGDGVGVAAAAAGYGNEEQAMRLQRTASASVSSGSHYPASSSTHYQNLTDRLNLSHLQLMGGSGATYYRQSGPSPSSSSGGGKRWKRLEGLLLRILPLHTRARPGSTDNYLANANKYGPHSSQRINC